MVMFAVLFIAGSPVGFGAQGEPIDALADARQRVADFEKPLMQGLLDGTNDDELRDSEKTRNAVRNFFADLDNRALRLAAMDLLDDRYVYLANPELTAELLGPLIRDPDADVRVRAANAIGYNACGAKYADELIAMLDGEPSADALVGVAYAMGRSGYQPFATHLEGVLRHPDPEVRSSALFELTVLNPEKALRHNLRLLEDPDPSVRRRAIQNFTLAPEEKVFAPLAGMLEDEDPRVRERAVWALGQMHVNDAADAIARRLSDADHHVRSRAALVLGQMRATPHADAVAKLLDDENVVVRRYATQAMGMMRDPRFVERLRPLLKDEDDQVRERAAEAIGQLEAVKN